MKQEKQRTNKTIRSVILIGMSLICALFCGGILFLISGYNPVQVYILIFQGAFGSVNSILTSLTYATPLIISGLAFSVAQKANMMNLGGEGQICVGAMAAALIGAYVIGLPSFLHLPLTLLCAFIIAGLYGALAGFLKVRFGSNEVIVTIMLNYIATLFCSYLVSYPLRGSSDSAQTIQIASTAKLGRIFSFHQLSTAFIMALCLSVLIWFMFKKTLYGYRVTVVGNNLLAAQTAGINVPFISISSMFLSAGIAGLCGAGQILGIHYRYIDNFSSGFGFEGIAVAALASANPLLVIVSGILFGGIKAGATTVNRVASIPMDYIFIIQALVIVFVAAPSLMERLIKLITMPIHYIRRRKACKM